MRDNIYLERPIRLLSFMKKFLFVAVFAAVSALLLSACSKDKDNGPKNGTHTVYYTIEGSSNVEVTGAVYTNAKGDSESRTDMSGSNIWKSEEFKINTATVKLLVIAATESTTDNANGTLTVKIFVDGKQVADNTGRGNILQASTSYSFY
jgi:hypothetical protein